MKSNFYVPLMEDNINQNDVNAVINFLSQPEIPKLTNGPKVREFEKRWSEWLGVKYSVFVNSGASANELTMLALKYLYGGGEIIVPPLTWVSDIASIMHAGLTPVFCDINLKNLSFDLDKLKKCITKDTLAVFPTHVLGINALSDELLEIVDDNEILLIEDVCESHGTTFKGKKVGTFGLASNFSFYYAHHMSTIEGGMVCTNDETFYNICRALRSHGMSREMDDPILKSTLAKEYPDVNPDFTFIYQAHNFRSTEINAVIGLNQLNRLDRNNFLRRENFKYFMKYLDSNKFITNLEMDGQCNYALIAILKIPNSTDVYNIEDSLRKNEIEFRRGLSGGGNQLRQPYLSHMRESIKQKTGSHMVFSFPNIEHVHHYSWYIGNYPSLREDQLDVIVDCLNNPLDNK